MNIRCMCATLIVGGLVATAAPTTVSLAQSNGQGVPPSTDAGASTPGGSTLNTNMTPTKHRYWRHRGGVHPHYGSRRVRT
jgi:hypothetical protein